MYLDKKKLLQFSASLEALVSEVLLPLSPAITCRLFVLICVIFFSSVILFLSVYLVLQINLIWFDLKSNGYSCGCGAAGAGREHDDVRASSVQSVRVVQPTPVQPGQRRAREHLHAVERVLVRRRYADAAGLRHQPASRVDTYRRRHVVVLHAHHHLVVHGEPRGVPDRGAHGVAHRIGRGSLTADQDLVRHNRRRIHLHVFQGQLFYRHRRYYAMPPPVGCIW